MQLKIDQSGVSQIMGKMQAALSDKSQGHFCLKAEGSSLEISFADRILAIYLQLDCKVEEAGIIFVSAKFFLDILRELPAGIVALSSEERWLKIEAESSFTIKMPLLQNLSWRSPPSSKGYSFVEVPAAKVAYMINQVQFCIAQESSRNYGTVGYMQKISDSDLRLVGTDGFRLAMCDIQIEGVALGNFPKEGVCLSKRALSEVSRMCSEAHETIQFALSEDQTMMMVAIDGYRIFILLSSAQYPNYEGVLPKGKGQDVLVGRAALHGMSKRVLLASGKTRAMHLKFEPNLLTLSSRVSGTSEGKEVMPLPSYEGEDVALSLNGKFLMDILSTTLSDDISISFKNDEDPLLILPTREPKGCTSKFVLVPVRENDH